LPVKIQVDAFQTLTLILPTSLSGVKAAPVFSRRGVKKGLFNDMLADYFVGCILTAEGWVREKWAQVNDLQQMAEIFQVTGVSVCRAQDNGFDLVIKQPYLTG